MATVISGILNRRLPWRLVLRGVFLVVSIELLGIRSLPFAVGSYLSIATTMAIFAGGFGSLASRANTQNRSRGSTCPRERDRTRIALRQRSDRRRRIFGLLGIVVALLEDQEFPYHIFRAGQFQIGPSIVGSLADSNVFAVLLFVLLAASQFYFARKKME